MTSLYPKPKLQDPKSRKILDKASRLLLQNRIHENPYIRKNLQSSIKQTADNLSDTLTQEHFTQMQEIRRKTYKHELEKTKERQLKIFNLTLLALGFFGWCSTGRGGGFPPPLQNSFVFKVRLLKFWLWDKINILQ